MNVMDIFGTHEVTIHHLTRTPTGEPVQSDMLTVEGVFFSPTQTLTTSSDGATHKLKATLAVPGDYVPLFTTDEETRVTFRGETYVVVGVEYTPPPVEGMPDVGQVSLS